MDLSQLTQLINQYGPIGILVFIVFLLFQKKPATPQNPAQPTNPVVPSAPLTLGNGLILSIVGNLLSSRQALGNGLAFLQNLLKLGDKKDDSQTPKPS